MAKKELTPNQETIRQYLRDQYRNQSIEWPSKIGVKKIEESKESITAITLTLTPGAMGCAKEKNKNMQETSACFEGWAVALRAANNDIKINLEATVAEDLPPFTVGKGHYGRFLYRALRFSKQYKEWFKLGDKLEKAVEDFEKFFNDKNNKLINNIPLKDAERNGKLECYIEAELAENKENRSVFFDCLEKVIEVSHDQAVYRQLPVGLFSEEVKDNKNVFTGGASAIDLWTLHEKTLHEKTLQIIELKAANRMVGIITEIFFYSNYMYDLLRNENITKYTKTYRGYDVLYLNRKSINKIQGIMLADIYHPLITSGVLKVLNAGSKSGEIEYFKAEYNFDVTVRKKE